VKIETMLLKRGSEERRVLVALRSGPAMLSLVSYASGVRNTQSVLRRLEAAGYVENTQRDTWALTAAGEEVVS